jgi:hypothetical protein
LAFVDRKSFGVACPAFVSGEPSFGAPFTPTRYGAANGRCS